MEKTKRIYIRLTPEELKAIKHLATLETEGNVSSYMRKIAKEKVASTRKEKKSDDRI